MLYNRVGNPEMTKTLEAVFDGKVFHPDVPPDLPPNRKYRLTVDTETATSAWVRQELERIDGFGSLARGWDSYSAEPPNRTARVWAREAINILDSMEFPPDRVAPSVDGGIALTWSREGKYANIEVFNSGEVITAKRDGDGNPVLTEVPTDKIEAGLRAIRDYLNA